MQSLAKSLPARPQQCLLSQLPHQKPLRACRCRAASGLSNFSSSAISGSGGQQQQVVDSLQQQLQQLQQVQLPDSQQSLQAVQQYGSQAAAAAAAAWANLVGPFAVFGDSHWLLNLLFLGSSGLLVYSVLFLAPRQ